MPETSFLTATYPDPLAGRQQAWRVVYEGRRGYSVAEVEATWDGRWLGAEGGIVVTVPSSRSALTSAVDPLPWGMEVFPDERSALSAAEFKNDMLVTLIVQRNEQLAARRRELDLQERMREGPRRG